MQQTSGAKLLVFFLKIKKRVCGLSVNETKPDTKNASNWDHFGFGVNNESKCDERAVSSFSPES